MRNRKSEYEKTQKESMVCFVTEAEASNGRYKAQLPRWYAEIYHSKNKHTQKQTQLGKELTITSQKIHQE